VNAKVAACVPKQKVGGKAEEVTYSLSGGREGGGARGRLAMVGRWCFLLLSVSHMNERHIGSCWQIVALDTQTGRHRDNI